MKVVQQQLLSYSDCFAFFDCTTEEVNSLQQCLNSQQTNRQDQSDAKLFACFSDKFAQTCTPSKRMKAER